MNRLAWMKLSFTLPIFVLWGCSQESGTVEESAAPQTAQQAETEPAPSEGAVTPTSYTEYLQCEFGENYSPEAFQTFLADWNAEISELPDRGVRAFGYMPRDWSSDAFDGIWVLRWPNVDDRNAGWKDYADSGAQARLRAAHPDLIECAPENELGMFAFDTYSRRTAPDTWTQETSPYAITMQICAMNDDRPLSDLRDFVTTSYLPYLDEADARLEGNTYWYQVAVMDEENSVGRPSTASMPFDFVWMNYWNSAEEEGTSMADWGVNGVEMQAQFDELATCQDAIPYNGYYFRTASN